MRAWIVFAALLLVASCGGGSNKAAPAPAPSPTPSGPMVQPNQPVSSELTDLERVSSATVFITTRYRPCDKTDEEMRGNDDALRTYFGSGFIVDPSGLIITNRHVVEAWQMETTRSGLTGLPKARTLYHLHDVTVRLASGTNKTRVYVAKVLATRELPDDVALLRIEPESDLPALKLADSESLRMQQAVWALGFPLGGNLEEFLKQLKLGKNPYGPDISVREGRVTSVRRDDQGAIKAVENSCPVEHGNSGGPVVNAAGEVVALTTYGLGDRTPTALPTERIRHHFGAYLDKLKAARETNGAPRVFRVTKNLDPEKRGKSEFGGPELMFHLARDGDIIEFDEGEWIVDDELWWNKALTLRIRGRGRDKSKLTLRKPMHIGPAAGHWLEISNLEIGGIYVEGDREASFQHNWVAEVLAGGQVFLSSVRVTRNYASGPCSGSGFDSGSNFPKIDAAWKWYAMRVAGESNVEVNQCEIKGCMIAGASGSPRISSTDFKWSSVGAHTASPVFSGCRLSTFVSGETRTSDKDKFGGAPVLTGCHFTEINTSVGLARSEARFDSCWIAGSLWAWAPTGETTRNSYSVSLAGCWFGAVGGNASPFGIMTACKLEGPVNASISDSLFHRNDGCVEAFKGCSLNAHGNYFLRSDMSIVMAVLPKAGESREDAIRRQAAGHATGLRIFDGAYVTYTGNHFDSLIGGVAVVHYGEATDTGGDDNLCTGYTSYKERRPE